MEYYFSCFQKKKHCRYSKEPSYVSLYTEEETSEKLTAFQNILFWNVCDLVCFKIPNKMSFPDPNTKRPFSRTLQRYNLNVTSLFERRQRKGKQLGTNRTALKQLKGN